MHSAAAQDRGDRSAPTANQIVAESDTRTARIKAELRLTADQEKNLRHPALAEA